MYNFFVYFFVKFGKALIFAVFSLLSKLRNGTVNLELVFEEVCLKYVVTNVFMQRLNTATPRIIC